MEEKTRGKTRPGRGGGSNAAPPRPLEGSALPRESPSTATRNRPTTSGDVASRTSGVSRSVLLERQASAALRELWALASADAAMPPRAAAAASAIRAWASPFAPGGGNTADLAAALVAVDRAGVLFALEGGAADTADRGRGSGSGSSAPDRGASASSARGLLADLEEDPSEDRTEDRTSLEASLGSTSRAPAPSALAATARDAARRREAAALAATPGFAAALAAAAASARAAGDARALWRVARLARVPADDAGFRTSRGKPESEGSGGIPSGIGGTDAVGANPKGKPNGGISGSDGTVAKEEPDGGADPITSRVGDASLAPIREEKPLGGRGSETKPRGESETHPPASEKPPVEGANADPLLFSPASAIARGSGPPRAPARLPGGAAVWGDVETWRGMERAAALDPRLFPENLGRRIRSGGASPDARRRRSPRRWPPSASPRAPSPRSSPSSDPSRRRRPSRDDSSKEGETRATPLRAYRRAEESEESEE